MPILHTCTAGVQDGVARCRKSVISDPTAPRKDRCDLHQGTGWASAPAPTTVLVKVNVNPTWWELLHRAGVRTFVRTFARASSSSRSTWLKRLLSDGTPMRPAISGTTSKPPKARPRAAQFSESPDSRTQQWTSEGSFVSCSPLASCFRRHTSWSVATNHPSASSWSSPSRLKRRQW